MKHLNELISPFNKYIEPFVGKNHKVLENDYE